jgi:hypothetical protein
MTDIELMVWHLRFRGGSVLKPDSFNFGSGDSIDSWDSIGFNSPLQNATA